MIEKPNTVDGPLPRTHARVEEDGEPTHLSKAVYDYWGFALVIALAGVVLGPYGLIEVSQTRSLVLQDAIYLAPVALAFGIAGPIVLSGWLRKQVFATEAGLRFEHGGQWWEVAWRDVGELQRASWDLRWRHALHYVDILDGSEPHRVHFVPTRDAIAFIDYYRDEAAARAKISKRRRKARRHRRSNTLA